MEADNSRTIYDWLYKVDTKELCLPTFQRRRVWSAALSCELMKTIILEGDIPVGTFLVLKVNTNEETFRARAIDDSEASRKICNSLLLDGQQRLSALWYALRDKEENRTYYIRFNESYEIEGVECKSKYRDRKKTPPVKQKLYENSVGQYQQNLFPVRLMNPFEQEKVVEGWVDELDLLPDDTTAIKNLIKTTREIFTLRKDKGGKVIPFFELHQDTPLQKAIQIYQTINKNSVKLTKHYLAIATMEGAECKSLYDIANRLRKNIPSIEYLEKDETTELVLKISCLLEGKSPSGSNYEGLDFEALVDNERLITDGIKWTVEKLEDLKIWDRRLLPSNVPLRVLPALYKYLPKSDNEYAKADQIVEKYLWHAFLTRRYDRQVDDRLKEDFEVLKKCFENGCKKIDIPIFNKRNNPWPTKKSIIETTWPTGQSIIARGVVLVCCQGGALSLTKNEKISKKSCEKRQHHHIFPKSKLSKRMVKSGNSAVNCLFIPKKDNQIYSNELPGDYIQKIFEKESDELYQIEVIDRLETHLISKDSARKLVSITKDKFDGRKKDLDNALKDFLESRAEHIISKISKLLSGQSVG